MVNVWPELHDLANNDLQNNISLFRARGAPIFLPFTAVVDLGGGGRASVDIRRLSSISAEVGCGTGRLRNSSFMSISFLIRLIISESPLFTESRL